MQTIYTIGVHIAELISCEYAKDCLFIGILREARVDGIIDIRSRTEDIYNRFASGSRLQSLLAAYGISYFREPRFAPSEEMLREYQSMRDWQKYERDYKSLFKERLMIVVWREMGCSFRRPCLLCSERYPGKCHRRLLAELLTEEIEGARVIHLP